MGVFDFLKKKPKGEATLVDVALHVKNMLDKNGFTYESNGNMFSALIAGKNANFKTGITCNGNELFVYSIFPIDVPKHIHIPISLEINRINKDNRDVSIVLNEKGDTADLGAFSQKKFISEPSDEELQMMVIRPVDVLDTCFSSLTCAMLGVANDEELKQRMLSSRNISEENGSTMRIQISDSYDDMLGQTEGISSPRFGGRLLALAVHVIENRISRPTANNLLTNQAEYTDIIQTAYNVADDEERNIIRKLAYLVSEKRLPSDDQSDEFIGRMEGMSIVENNMQDLFRRS